MNFYYNEQVDSFTLLIVSQKIKKIVHYIDEHVALLYDPETKEIVGVRIESFKREWGGKDVSPPEINPK